MSANPRTFCNSEVVHFRLTTKSQTTFKAKFELNLLQVKLGIADPDVLNRLIYTDRYLRQSK